MNDPDVRETKTRAGETCEASVRARRTVTTQCAGFGQSRPVMQITRHNCVSSCPAAPQGTQLCIRCVLKGVSPVHKFSE